VTSASWGAQGDTSANPWQIEPSWSTTTAGFEVLDIERAVLPMVGSARIIYRMGVIDDKLNGVLSSGADPRSWNPATMTAMAPSLLGREIRIQAQVASGWITVFWGQVEYEEDEGWTASVLPSGSRTYHLTDALARTRKWQFQWHAFGGRICRGGAGYNESVGNVVIGNKGSGVTKWNGSNVRQHALPGAGSAWTDEDVIEHALAIARPSGEPLWAVPNTDATTYLAGNCAPIRITSDTTAWDVVSRVANWKQGRGVVYLDWSETPSTDTAVQPLTTSLRCVSPFADDFSRDASAFGGSTLTWPGAVSGGTLISVDLIGDHRAVDGALKLGDPDAFRVDYLESAGEPIEQVVTLSVLDQTLEKRWSTADETALAALAKAKRSGDRWKPVGQRFGIPTGWIGNAGDGNGSAAPPALIMCTDQGIIDTATSVGPLTCRILPDMPILEGYSYAGATPARADGSSTTTETSAPVRKAPLPLVRMSANVYDLADSADIGMTLRIQGSDIWLSAKDDEENGERYFASTSGLSPAFAPTAALVTVAIASDALPVRFARAALGKTETTARRRKTIRHADLALWYATSGAIYDIDSETPSGSGFAPKRGACRTGTGTGILRDDRLALLSRHELACRWYGLPDAAGKPGESRRSASWSLRAFGLGGTFAIVDENGKDAGTVDYPTIGKCVQYLYTNGSKITLNTPITRVRYDHQNGVTTWSTDWQELDFA
jgi:hypothetical protein